MTVSHFDLFVSYARSGAVVTIDHKSIRVVPFLKRALERHRHPRNNRRFRVCTDVEDFRIEGPVPSAIQERLRASEALLVLCDNASAESDWVRFEIDEFRTRPDTTGKVLGARVDLLPTVAFPDAFPAGMLHADLSPGPYMNEREWRAAVLQESHKIVATVWSLEIEEVYDRFKADTRRRAIGMSATIGFSLALAGAIMANPMYSHDVKTVSTGDTVWFSNSMATTLVELHQSKPICTAWTTTDALRKYPCPAAPSQLIEVSPNGRLAASATAEGDVFIWPTDKGSTTLPPSSLSNLDFDFDSPWSRPTLAFSENGEWILVTTSRSEIYVWQTSNPAPPRVPFLHLPTTGRITRVDAQLSPSGRWLAAADADGRMAILPTSRYHDDTDFRPILDVHSISGKRFVTFSRDEKWVAATNSKGELCLWRPGEDPVVVSGLGENDSSRQSTYMTAFSPDGNWLVARKQFEDLYLVQTSTARARLIVRTPNVYNDPGLNASFDASSTWFAATARNSAVYAWTIDMLDREGTMQVLLPDQPKTFAHPPALALFSPDGRHMAGITQLNRVFVWDTGLSAIDATPVATVVGDSARVYFSSDSKWLYAIGVGGTDLYYGHVGAVLKRLSVGARIVGAAPASDGKQMLLLTTDGAKIATRHFEMWGLKLAPQRWPIFATDNRNNEMR